MIRSLLDPLDPCLSVVRFLPSDDGDPSMSRSPDLVPDPNHGQHPPGLAFFLAMGEELAWAADGAVFQRRDVPLRHARGQQLAAVGLTQVKMHLDARIAMAGRALVHEEH